MEFPRTTGGWIAFVITTTVIVQLFVAPLVSKIDNVQLLAMLGIVGVAIVAAIFFVAGRRSVKRTENVAREKPGITVDGREI